MAGLRPGEVRISIETGPTTRFAVTRRPGPGRITAAETLRHLPTLVAELRTQLTRAADREKAASKKKAPDNPAATGRGPVRNTTAK